MGRWKSARRPHNYPIMWSSGRSRRALMRNCYWQNLRLMRSRASPTFTALSSYAHIPCSRSNIK